MIRYTVTQSRPSGWMYHGPTSLARRHETNSIRGARRGSAAGAHWIDNDFLTDKDGTLWCAHGYGVIEKEGFSAPGVPNLPLDKLTTAQVEKLRKGEYRLQRAEAMFRAYRTFNIGVALELKGDGREGWRIVDRKYVDIIVGLANKYGVRMYVKCDPRKKPLVKMLGWFREAGVWVRFNESDDFLPPIKEKPVSYPAPNPPYVGPAAHTSAGDNKPINRIVLHSTVSPCERGQARKTAAYFRSERAKGSAHYVVDPFEVVQVVYDGVIAWHAPPNAHSIGIEMCEYPDADSKARWNSDNHKRMFVRAARLTAQLCLAYNVPPWFRTASELKAGKRGVTTHAQVSQAWHQSSHWDPGAWPRYKFMWRVRYEYAKLKAAR